MAGGAESTDGYVNGGPIVQVRVNDDAEQFVEGDGNNTDTDNNGADDDADDDDNDRIGDEYNGNRDHRGCAVATDGRFGIDAHQLTIFCGSVTSEVSHLLRFQDERLNVLS